MKTTKYALFSAFMAGKAFSIVSAGIGGEIQSLSVINSIEREDGSNHRYNVTGLDKQTGCKVTFHVQTVD